jgi:hypothetical protein
MFKIQGLDELQNKISKLARKTEGLDGQHNVPVSELLTDSFIFRHTSFLSADEMFKASGFQIETQEDLAGIPENDWDIFIRSVSDFGGWQSMLGAAGEEWVQRKLGL